MAICPTCNRSDDWPMTGQRGNCSGCHLPFSDCPCPMRKSFVRGITPTEQDIIEAFGDIPKNASPVLNVYIPFCL